MLDDGSVALLDDDDEPHHFLDKVALPRDALLGQATATRRADGGLEISVPRQRPTRNDHDSRPHTARARPAPPPAPSPAPRAAPAKTAPRASSSSSSASPPQPTLSNQQRRATFGRRRLLAASSRSPPRARRPDPADYCPEGEEAVALPPSEGTCVSKHAKWDVYVAQ